MTLYAAMSKRITSILRSMALMRAIDHINQSYGVDTVCVGGSSAAPSWHNKCDHRSGNYLTDIKGILQVGCDMFGGLRKK